MTTKLSARKLRAVQSFDDVLAMLRDELDWPIEAKHLEETSFEYRPEELGLDPERAPSLLSIRQLQPLTIHQPWGIFFLDFSGPRLPITPLRRLLQTLVTAKRKGAKGHATWNLEDLLFVITTDSGDAVELHFVAFFDAGDHVAEIRSLPWRPSESPQQYLDRLAHELLPHLVWPRDTDDLDDWRSTWRSAFALRLGEAIKTAERLADRMAQVAVTLRGAIAEALTHEGPSGPFHRLLDEVREELVAGVDEEGFADMCAQTLVSGTLTARVTDPQGFGASPTLAVVPLTNPFLAAFFEQVHDQVTELDLEASGLEQLVADLRASNVEAVLDQFGSTAKGGDPVVHFYEEFLKRYDASMRTDAGAFYTPQPVVEFMVRAVDDVMKTYFGLPDGLADCSTWSDLCDRLGLRVPDGIDAGAPFISMLDPATGTGTYLVEWLRRSRLSFATTHPAGDWSARLQDFVLASMHAFELMLAPYAIAHLKVALEVHTQGVDSSDAAIRLTDTLEHAAAQPKLAAIADPVALEGERAAALKQHGRFTAIIGNPPYDRVARNAGGGWVTDAGPGQRSLFDDILDPAIEHTIFSHHASLYNKYVYFWRWALWKAFEDNPAGTAVVSYITASSWLTGPGFLGLRQLVRQLADEVCVVDLGGDNKGARPEENVFDIETPVAIVTMYSRGQVDRAVPARVRYRRVEGTRAEKLATLHDLDPAPAEPGWKDAPTSWFAPFVPSSGDAGWDSFPALIDLFPWQQPGCMYNRTWPVAPSPELLEMRWKRLLSSKDPDERARCFVTGSSGRNIHTAVGNLERIVDLRRTASHRPIERYGWRSFDREWALADPRLAKTESPSLWMSRSQRQVFLTTIVTQPLGSGPAATVTTAVPDRNFFSGRSGAVIALYRDSAGTPNASRATLEAITAIHRSALIEAQDVTAERLFAYVYAMLAGTDYTARFAEALNTPGPRVPITADPDLFQRAVEHGERLLWLHTFGDRSNTAGRRKPIPRAASVNWTTPISRIPEDTRDFAYDPTTETLHIADGAVSVVPANVWAFDVSGMPVLKKWLGYRTRKGTGRAAQSASPLDKIRPTDWHDDWSAELIELVTVLERTIQMLPTGAELLEDVCAGPLIRADELPGVSPELRQPPAASWQSNDPVLGT